MDRPAGELIQRMLAAAAGCAEGRADRLIAEAVDEAEAEVRTLVKSALKAAFLQRAVARLEALPEIGDSVPPSQDAPPERIEAPPTAADAGQRPPEAASARPDHATVPETGYYIYCITHDRDGDMPPDLLGLDPDSPVRAIRRNSLQAIVSVVSLEDFTRNADARELDWLERRVRAHDEVVKRTTDHGPVIPLRFGTVVRNEQDVRQILQRHQDELERTLEGLEGKSEWGVRISATSEALAGPPEPVHAGASGAARSGKTYLLERRRNTTGREQVRRTVQSQVQKCHHELAALAADAVILPLARAADPARPGHADAEPALNAAYLVAEDRLQEFQDLATALAEQYEPRGLILEMTGPWPAYNFVHLDLSEGAES